MKTLRNFSLLAIACLFLISMDLDLRNLFNYANQDVPVYITRDNTTANQITDEGATLGRVLFYDKKLSTDNTIACASCHHQSLAFGDTSVVSQGVNGVTGRHSMRLVNSRFAEEEKYFWDERAETLEIQTTQPIRDHIEMGYSGAQGAPTFQDLLVKLDTISYYNDLFQLAFGDTIITEERIQQSIAQFIRSIQSFDSPYDVGRSQVAGDSLPFPNYSQAQNAGKALFLDPIEIDANSSRVGGGLGCASCHRPPEFDIDPTSMSNGVVFTPGSTMPNGGVDTLVFKAPSLRDVVDANGNVNGRLMHTANFTNLAQVMNHYDRINLFGRNPEIGRAIDPRLVPNGIPLNLNSTNQERNQVIAFLGTLTGSDVYTNEKWSNPFDENGELTIINSPTSSVAETPKIELSIYPNPASQYLNIEGEISGTTINIFDVQGRVAKSISNTASDNISISLSELQTGTYILRIEDNHGNVSRSEKFIKK